MIVATSERVLTLPENPYQNSILQYEDLMKTSIQMKASNYVATI